MQIIKRDGQTVPFDIGKIRTAITACYADMGQNPKTDIKELSLRVLGLIMSANIETPTVEQVQSFVDIVLREQGEDEAANHFLAYRTKRMQAREQAVPDDVKLSFDDAASYFPTPLQQFQFFDKYSRFDYGTGRRETWIETVDRTVAYLRELSSDLLDAEIYERIRVAILTMQVMPSMRLLAMAGDAARRNNISIYNCAYLPVDSIESFVEALIISMSGCGVGFSVEKQHVHQLPIIRPMRDEITNYLIEDTAEGWANALRFGLLTWFDGGDVRFDYSQIRPAGSVLRTKGGRASGPRPLMDMLEFCRSRIILSAGERLTTLDAHDMMCAVGNASISGGHRRTAMISLFDWDDRSMWLAKSGDFHRYNSQRWNANNSVVWPAGGVSAADLMRQMLTMDDGGGGEPGIFNRQSAINLRPERRKPAQFGTNPCGEIILKPRQFCNLSAVIARAEDTLETLQDKVEIATIIGTIQSMATHFPGLGPEWKANGEEERLLGVDITGQMDSPEAQKSSTMRALRERAIQVNRDYSEKLGINQSVSVTCCKPSGNTSQLVNCSSGIHARFASYYIRNVRVSGHSPIYKVLRDAGVPMNPENGQTVENATMWVASFPVKSPENAITRDQMTALQQCDYWLRNKSNWTEHNPSVTISYKPDELIAITEWIWEHMDVIGGMSFLPASDANYSQMPYIEITKEEYEKRIAEFPTIDFSRVYLHEKEDHTTAAQEVACAGGLCEI